MAGLILILAKSILVSVQLLPHVATLNLKVIVLVVVWCHVDDVIYIEVTFAA